MEKHLIDNINFVFYDRNIKRAQQEGCVREVKKVEVPIVKKILAFVLAAALTLSLAACGGSGGSTAASGTVGGKQTMITIGCKNTIPSLAPFSPPNPFINLILGEVYMHLAERVAVGDTEMTGCLAKSWTQTGNTTYDFELYDGITDSEGNPFTASDVKFCFEQAALSGVAPAHYVESVEVADDTHFTLHLTTDSIGVLEQVCENVFMVTQAAYEASADSMATKPVSTGPYTVLDYVAGSYVILQKNEKFWQTPELTPASCQANVDIIKFDILTENIQMQGALQGDTIQAAFQVNSDLVSVFQEDSRYETSANPGGTYRYLVFNQTEDSPFHDNLALREAVCYAIDAAGINAACSSGLDNVPANVGTSDYIGYNPSWNSDPGKYYAYDKAKAQALLAEAGYQPGGVTVRLGVNALSSVQSYFEMIASELNDIGINTEIAIYEANVYSEKQLSVTANEWDIILGYSNTSIYQINQWSAQLDNNVFAHGLTQGGVDDPDLQALVDACQSPDWTQEELDELYQYQMDNCLSYHFLDNKNYHVANTSIEQLYCVGSSQTWRVGSFTFSDDWGYYYQP